MERLHMWVIERFIDRLLDSAHGATASANLYSLVMSAKAIGLEPYAYLRHLFEHLPSCADPRGAACVAALARQSGPEGSTETHCDRSCGLNPTRSAWRKSMTGYVAVHMLTNECETLTTKIKLIAGSI
jgi:hypothetical protein